jgi:uncharacterized protein YutE (UPF0331/DUF86 family)
VVKKAVLEARLERVREYLDILDSVLKFDERIFLSDPFIYSTAERNLHLIIEALIDIGNHVISDRGYPKPETYAEVFRILRDRDVISENLFNQIDGMTSFRNLLVHDYLKIDRKQIYQLLKTRLSALKSLAGVYAELI